MSLKHAISEFFRGFLNLALTDGREDDSNEECSSCAEDEGVQVTSHRHSLVLLNKSDGEPQRASIHSIYQVASKRVSFAKDKSPPADHTSISKKRGPALKQQSTVMSRTFDKENERPNFKYT